jgi:prepilin-type N-terminal cleavage/methylation domain-containing protein
MLRNRTNSKGFTLIEVLVALCAMAFAFVALWTLHLSSLKVDARTNHETEATLLGNRTIEECRTRAAVDFSLVASTNAVAAVGGIYTQTLNITPITPWRKDVAITLTWPEQIKLGDGSKSTATRSVQLSTILTNLELN